MLFEEQARIFVQLIISKATWPIFVSWYLPKKELSRMLVHVRKIFNCKVSFKSRCEFAS